MTKLAISLCVIYLAYSAPIEVPFPVLSTYFEELNASFTNFKTEVEFVINQAQTVIDRHRGLFKTLRYSATCLQKEISDDINSTKTRFDMKLSYLFADTSVNVSKCIDLSSAVESTATDILIEMNTCTHEKLNQAELYIEKSILSIEQISAHLDSLRNIANESFKKAIKYKKAKTLLETKMFLKSISAKPSQVATEIISILTDTTLVISKIDSLMISDCMSTDAISFLVKDMQLAYSEIKTCIVDLNSLNADLQSVQRVHGNFGNRRDSVKKF